MKICLIGCVEFSAQTLRYIINLAQSGECELVGVITKPTSKFNADFVDLSSVIAEGSFQTPVHYYQDEKSATAFVQEINADVIYCFGWSSLLGRKLLNAAPKGVIGYHPAALPANRGRHPIIWALILGLSETASTFFQMDEGADSGPIISQKGVIIDSEDNATSLYQKLIDVALPQIRCFTHELSEGWLKPTPQKDDNANYWRKRSPEDGLIDWRMQAEDVHNLVRGLTRPYPGAEIKSETGATFKVWCSSLDTNPHPRNFEPGKILNNRQSQILVKCAGTSAIWLTEHEIPTELAQSGYL